MTGKEKAELSDLYMIKEGDEMVQSPGSRQIYKKYSKISSLSERSASTSNIDKELLNKPTENIITQCKTGFNSKKKPNTVHHISGAAPPGKTLLNKATNKATPKAKSA